MRTINDDGCWSQLFPLADDLPFWGWMHVARMTTTIAKTTGYSHGDDRATHNHGAWKRDQCTYVLTYYLAYMGSIPTFFTYQLLVFKVLTIWRDGVSLPYVPIIGIYLSKNSPKLPVCTSNSSDVPTVYSTSIVMASVFVQLLIHTIKKLYEIWTAHLEHQNECEQWEKAHVAAADSTHPSQPQVIRKLIYFFRTPRRHFT